jgi:hypothetical protein
MNTLNPFGCILFVPSGWLWGPGQMLCSVLSGRSSNWARWDEHNSYCFSGVRSIDVQVHHLSSFYVCNSIIIVIFYVSTKGYVAVRLYASTKSVDPCRTLVLIPVFFTCHPLRNNAHGEAKAQSRWRGACQPWRSGTECLCVDMVPNSDDATRVSVGHTRPLWVLWNRHLWNQRQRSHYSNRIVRGTWPHHYQPFPRSRHIRLHFPQNLRDPIRSGTECLCVDMVPNSDDAACVSPGRIRRLRHPGAS